MVIVWLDIKLECFEIFMWKKFLIYCWFNYIKFEIYKLFIIEKFEMDIILLIY